MILTKIRTKIESLIKYEKNNTVRVVILLLLSVVFAVILERIYTYVHNMYVNITGIALSGPGFLNSLTEFSMMSVYRTAFLFCILFFISIHFILKIPVLYDNIFRYRYVIAVLVFLLLVAFKINFSSVGMYDQYIQPGYGSEFTTPVFGKPRGIRSDEWVVGTPVQLAAQYGNEPYGRYNDIVRGTETENMPFGMNINLAALAFPLNVFYLLGVEYGVSARWVGVLIITIMVTFELMYIISRKNRLLALTGACLVAFSPFFQWWSHVIFIPAGIGTLVCFYYFLNCGTRLKKILLSLGITIFFSMFVVHLYPAWQIPVGYLYLGLAAWIIVENREKVRALKIPDWGILGLAMILISAVVGTYLWESREYTAGITGTVFPGARIFSGGGIGTGSAINRMMNGGVFAPVSAFKVFSQTNICEFGGFYTLFPIPVLFTMYVMIRKRVFDLLSNILIFITLVLGTYIILGWPQRLASFTLMSYSPSYRVLDVLIFTQVFLLIRSMALHTELRERNDSKLRIGVLSAAVAAGVFMTFAAVYFNGSTFIEPISLIYFAIPFIGFILIAYTIFDCQQNKRIFKAACFFIIALTGVTWMTVHPVMKGLDAIYSKPLSLKITEHAGNTDEKWISLNESIVDPSFLIASGASTINSVNLYPNIDLWHKLDPGRQYEDVYNRYAHVTLSLTTEETSFEVRHADVVQLNLSYNDLALAGVKYIHSPYPVEDYNDIKFTLLYNEGGAYIYSVS